jgi:hypothetical protein
MLVRETIVSRIVNSGEVNRVTLGKLYYIMTRVLRHISENNVPDVVQIKRNENLFNELAQAQECLLADGIKCSDWKILVDYAMANYSMETQETINSLLMELYPELVDDLENDICVDESYEMQLEMLLFTLK